MVGVCPAVVAAAAATIANLRVAEAAASRLFGEGGSPLQWPRWHGPALEQLSEEPPMFVLRGLLSGAEAEQLVFDYNVDLLPAFERASNTTAPDVFRLCQQKFPQERCGIVKDSANSCDFHEDPAHYRSPGMEEVDRRIANVIGVAPDHVEAAWLFNWASRSQGLHLDNYHHFMSPQRIATVLVRLRPDPVGVAFPLARSKQRSAGTGAGCGPLSTHDVAEDDALVASLAKEANTLPFRGSGTGRHLSSGAVRDAFLELCATSPIRLGQGDALLYYHLDGHGEVDVRALHASCPVSPEQSIAPKLFMAKFVRGASLLNLHGSLRSPHALKDLRLWMDRRSQESGLDAAVVTAGEHETPEVLVGSACSSGLGSPLWLVRPSTEDMLNASVMCSVPGEAEYTVRQPGERFEVGAVFANVGRRPWPAGVVLSLRDGDPLGASAMRIGQDVEVGAIFHVVLPLVAPHTGQAAHGVWSLTDLDRRPFGPLLWVDAVGRLSGQPSEGM